MTRTIHRMTMLAALAGALAGCASPLPVSRLVETGGPVYGVPAYQKDPYSAEGAYGAQPGEGAIHVIPVDPRVHAPTEGP